MPDAAQIRATYDFLGPISARLDGATVLMVLADGRELRVTSPTGAPAVEVATIVAWWNVAPELAEQVDETTDPAPKRTRKPKASTE